MALSAHMTIMILAKTPVILAPIPLPLHCPYMYGDIFRDNRSIKSKSKKEDIILRTKIDALKNFITKY